MPTSRLMQPLPWIESSEWYILSGAGLTLPKRETSRRPIALCHPMRLSLADQSKQPNSVGRSHLLNTFGAHLDLVSFPVASGRVCSSARDLSTPAWLTLTRPPSHSVRSLRSHGCDVQSGIYLNDIPFGNAGLEVLPLSSLSSSSAASSISKAEGAHAGANRATVLPAAFPTLADDVGGCVLRLVTRGSGIERFTSARSVSEPRPRTRSMTLDDHDDDDVKLLEPDAQTKLNADENLAMLNTLSADLARFNEMLRAGGSRLRPAHTWCLRPESAERRAVPVRIGIQAAGGRAGGKGTRSALKLALGV
ncbi:hypothetical protein BJ912DRAFT_1141037 [Pholiota molesta]|nr:hypothetical protein BJ912DRAFT_1141037 [Pholiota molesta]